MSADFIAGYVSGAIGIIIGNPLDLLKTRIQAGSVSHEGQGSTQPLKWTRQFDQWSTLVRGAAAPILGYGALNALLFVTYNRTLALINSGSITDIPDRPSAASIWAAGALGGLATFVVSAPTELVKCQAQVSNPARSSWQIAQRIWNTSGIRGLYLGGGITSIRDSVGYGFYFWSYELLKRRLSSEDDDAQAQALKVLFCGGIAGVVTWASIFPMGVSRLNALDVVKTRVQTHSYHTASIASTVTEARSLLSNEQTASTAARTQSRPTTWQVTKEIYRAEGVPAFFRGLGVCSARAFIVNAVQWAVYEWTMTMLTK